MNKHDFFHLFVRLLKEIIDKKPRTICQILD